MRELWDLDIFDEDVLGLEGDGDGDGGGGGDGDVSDEAESEKVGEGDLGDC